MFTSIFLSKNCFAFQTFLMNRLSNFFLLIVEIQAIINIFVVVFIYAKTFRYEIRTEHVNYCKYKSFFLLSTLQTFEVFFTLSFFFFIFFALLGFKITVAKIFLFIFIIFDFYKSVTVTRSLFSMGKYRQIQ